MMDIHRNMVILFLSIFLSYFNEFSTAENVVSTSNGQHDIVIQPLSGASNGDTFARDLLLPNSTVKVIVDLRNVQNASFLVFQVHSYIQPLFLSSALPAKANNSVSGTDIGLYTNLTSRAVNGTIEYFVYNPNDVTVDFMLVPMFYSSEDPVPGGCNLSFLISIAPFLTLTFNSTNGIVQVDAQGASAQYEEECQPSGLAYEVYEFYTSDSSADAYFDTIRSVITADKAANKGFASPKPIRQPELRRRFAIYPKFGSVYVVTVRNIKTGKSSAYVPISNYNCIDGNDGNCDYDSQTVSMVWVVAVASLMYVFAEIRYIIGKDVTYVMRLLSLVAILIPLSSALPTDFGMVLLCYLSMGIPLVSAKSEHPLVLRIFNQTYRFITDCFYAMVPTSIVFGFNIPSIQSLQSTFVSYFTIVIIFLAFFSFFSYLYHFYLQRGKYLDTFCGVFFLIILVSYAANGILFYIFMDSARYLQSEFSDVVFYRRIPLVDNIVAPLWLILTATYPIVCDLLREFFTLGEYQEIINNCDEHEEHQEIINNSDEYEEPPSYRTFKATL